MYTECLYPCLLALTESGKLVIDLFAAAAVLNLAAM